MSKNSALILRLQKIRDLIDTRGDEDDSDSLSFSPPIETSIPPTRLSHKKKAKTSKSKNPPSQKYKSDTIGSEKALTENKKSPKHRSKSTSKSPRKNYYYMDKLDNSFSDDEIPINTKVSRDVPHHHKSSKGHKHSHKSHAQDKYDFNENKKSRTIKYYNESPYSNKKDIEKNQLNNSNTYKGYYYTTHDSDTGSDKYRKSSNDYYYVSRNKEEPLNTRGYGIYLSNQFKSSRSPSPIKSIHDEVYKYGGILDQHKKKNRKYGLFDSSSDSFHFNSSSEEELDRYKKRKVEKTRKYIQNLNLSSSSDDIDTITSKYRKSNTKETTKRSITSILGEKDLFSLSDDSDFSLKKPNIPRSIPNSIQDSTQKSNNFLNRNRYLDNITDSSSSDDLTNMVNKYSFNLKSVSKNYIPTKSTKTYGLSSSDDESFSQYRNPRQNKVLNISSSSDDDTSQYNLVNPLSSLRNKSTKPTSKNDDFKKYNYKLSSKNISSTSKFDHFLDSDDDDSSIDIKNYARFTLNKHYKTSRDKISSSSSNSDFENNVFNLKPTRLYDDDLISKKRAALRNIFTDVSDSSSSSSINIDEILAQKEIAKQTQRILEDDSDLNNADDSDLILRPPQKRSSSQKTNLKLSVPISHHSPEIKDKQSSRVNNRIALDDDDDDLLKQLKDLTNIDNDTKNSKKNKQNNNMNLQFSSSDSADEIYNKYSANSDQNIQNKTKKNQQDDDDIDDENSSTDDLLNKYSNFAKNTSGKKVEINQNQQPKKKSSKENQKPNIDDDDDDDAATKLINQLKENHLLSSDDEFENLLKKNNNNTTKTEVITDSDTEFQGTMISKPSSANDQKKKENENDNSQKQIEEEEEENDNLTDELMEKYKYDITNSSEGFNQNKDKSKEATSGKLSKKPKVQLQPNKANIKKRLEDEEENEEEKNENLDSTIDIIEEGKDIDKQLAKVFDESKEEGFLSPSDNENENENEVQSTNNIDSKIADFDERLEQLASDNESTKKKHESLHWKSSSDELPKQDLPHYFSSSTANDNENEGQVTDNANKSDENANENQDNDLDLFTQIPDKNDIRIGRSPSNDIRVEDDIAVDVPAENDDPSNKQFSSKLFNFNSSSNASPQKKEEKETKDDEEEANEDKDMIPIETNLNDPQLESPKKKKMNINPLVIPTNKNSSIENFTSNQEGSGVATPIKSPDDKLPGVFNSDNSSDDVFGLTQPSPKSITPSPFNSDAEIFENENGKQNQTTPKANKQKRLNLSSSESSPNQQQKKTPPPIPHPESSKQQNNSSTAGNGDVFDVNIEVVGQAGEEEEEEFNELIQIVDDIDKNAFDNEDDNNNNAENIQTFENNEGMEEEFNYNFSATSNPDDDSTNDIHKLIRNSFLSSNGEIPNDSDVDNLLKEHKQFLNDQDKQDEDADNEEEEEVVGDLNQFEPDVAANEEEEIVDNANQFEVDVTTNNEEEEIVGDLNQFEPDAAANEEEAVGDLNQFEPDADNEEEEIIGELNQFEAAVDNKEEEEAVGDLNQFEPDAAANEEEAVGDLNQFEPDAATNEEEEAAGDLNQFEPDAATNEEEEIIGELNQFEAAVDNEEEAVGDLNQFEPDAATNEEEEIIGELNQFEAAVDNEEEEENAPEHDGTQLQENLDTFDEVAIERELVPNKQEEEEINNQLNSDNQEEEEEKIVVKSRGINLIFDGNDHKEEEESENEFDNFEQMDEIVVKPREIVQIKEYVPAKDAQEKGSPMAGEEEEDDGEFDNFERMDEIVVEPREFVQIEEYVPAKDAQEKGSPSPKKEAVAGEEESENEFDNYERMDEIVVEPREFVQIEEYVPAKDAQEKGSPKKEEAADEEEDDGEFDNFERMDEIVVKPREIVQIDEYVPAKDAQEKSSPSPKKEAAAGEEESENEFDNYERMDEIVVEPREFVQIDEYVPATKDAPEEKSASQNKEEAATAGGEEESENEFDNFERMDEIVVEPREFVQIDEFPGNKNEGDDLDQIFDDQEEDDDDDIFQKGEEFLKNIIDGINDDDDENGESDH